MLILGCFTFPPDWRKEAIAALCSVITQSSCCPSQIFVSLSIFILFICGSGRCCFYSCCLWSLFLGVALYRYLVQHWLHLMGLTITLYNSSKTFGKLDLWLKLLLVYKCIHFPTIFQSGYRIIERMMYYIKSFSIVETTKGKV